MPDRTVEPTAQRVQPPWVFLILMAATAGLLVWLASRTGGWYVVDPTLPKGWLNLQFLMGGFGYTILLSLLSFAISIVLGLLVAFPGLSDNRGARWFNRLYVELLRAVPALVMILWVYYGLPELLGLSLTAFWAGVIALSLTESAFQAEVFRAGIQSIGKGQLEAADALGLTYWKKMRLVVLPQAVRRILPPLANQFVYVLKMSSLVSVIGVGELTRRANELTVTEYRALEIYSVLAAEYLLLVLIASAFARWLEKKLNADARQFT